MQFVIKYSVIFCCVFLFACQGSNRNISPSGDSPDNGNNGAIPQENAPALSIERNQVLQTLLNRKSVRNYTDKEVPLDVVEQLLKAGMAAPSSKDRRPWHFIVISDKDMLKNLGGQLKNASCLKDANKAIVVCGDDRLSDNCWFLDCSAVTQNILIAAEAMGLGAVWTSVFPYEDRMDIVNKAFRLEENIHPLSIIPLGYPSKEVKAKNKYDESRIHYDKW